ncbi:uncharacterized protein [Amphiura filiformis]|uniref:uncharacterized protein n=1 Tax=Amphiura filiformis TaxID=82378 RepID=UPI003B21EDF0
MDISKGAKQLDFVQFNSLLERLQQTWIDQQVSQSQVVKSLEDNCKKLNLAFHGKTPADGNCFFNAISDQLNLLGLPHQSPWEIRQSVVEFLRRNPSIQAQDGTIDFQAIHPDWERYCTSIARDGEWADHIVITATAHLLQREIVIVTSSPQGVDSAEPFIRISCNQDPSSIEPLLLGHVWECHYQSLMRTDIDIESCNSVSPVGMMSSSRVHMKEPSSPIAIDEQPVSLTALAPPGTQGKDTNTASINCPSPVGGVMSSSPVHQKELASPIDEQAVSQIHSISAPPGTQGLSDLSELLSLQDIFKDQQDKQPDDRGINMYVNNPSLMKNQTVITGDHIHVDQQNIYLLETGMNQRITAKPNPVEKVDMKVPVNLMLQQQQQLQQQPLQLQQQPCQQQPISTHGEGSALMPVIRGSQDPYELAELRSAVQDAIQHTTSNSSKGQQDHIVIVNKPTIVKGGVTQVTGDQYSIGQQSTYMHKETDLEEETTKWRGRLVKKYSQDRSRIRFGKSTRAVADTDDIFVDLMLKKYKEMPKSKNKEHVHDIFSGSQYKSSSEKSEVDVDLKLESHEDLLSLKDKKGGDVSHVLLYGPAGTGKTTLISRMAYTWAIQASTSAESAHNLSRKRKSNWSEFELVFVLDIRRFKSEDCLEQVIQKQLLPGVTVEHIANVMSKLGPKCLIMLDGYDEKQKDVDENIMNSPLLSECFVIVTMRPHVLGEFCCQPGKSDYVQVEVSGFSPENVNKYIHNFFKRTTNPRRAFVLIQKLETTPIFKSLSSFPILLVMMCLLWEDSQRPDIPYKTMTGLYQQAVVYLNKPFQQTHRGGMTSKAIDDVLIKLGKPAYKALCESSLQISGDKFEDQEALEQSFEIGLTTREEGDLIGEVYVSFIHKTFQEFCAAKYLASLAETDPAAFNAHLQTIDEHVYFDLQYLLQFCCGLKTLTAKAVVSHVASLKYLHALFFILVLMYEAEHCCKAKDTSWLNTELTPLVGSSLHMGTDLHGNDGNDVVFAFFYFINSELFGRHKWLQEIMEFKLYKYDSELSLRNLVRALQCMPSVEYIDLRKVEIVNDDGDAIHCKLGHISQVCISDTHVDVDTVLSLLICFQSVDKLIIRKISLIGKVESSKITSQKYPSVRKLEVGNVSCPGDFFDVNAESLFKFLRYLPYLEVISLVSLRVSGSLECFASVPNIGYRKIFIGYVTISASVFERLFCCKSAILENVVLDNVTITGIYPHLSLSCGHFKYGHLFRRLDQSKNEKNPSKLLKLSCVSSSSMSPLDPELPDTNIVPTRNISFIPPTYFEEISLSNIALVNDMSTTMTEHCASCVYTNCHTQIDNTEPDISIADTTEYVKLPRKLDVQGPFNHFLTLTALNTFIRFLQSVESIRLCEVNLADNLDDGSDMMCRSVKRLQIDTFSLIPVAMTGKIDRSILGNYSSNKMSNERQSAFRFGSQLAHKETNKLEFPPVDISALMKFLHCMPSLTTVKLVGCTGITGELKKSVQKSLEFLGEFILHSKSRYTIDVPAHTMLRLLGCMPSVRTVNLSNVVWTDGINEIVVAGCLALKEFIMSAGSMSIVTLVNALHLMPSVEIVNLSRIQLTGKLENVSKLSCNSMKEFHLICDSEIYSQDMMQLLSGMPKLTLLRLCAIFVGEIYVPVPFSLKALQKFEIGGSLSAKAIMVLLSCMPSVTTVNLGMFLTLGPLRITGDGTRDIYPVCKCAKNITLFLSTSSSKLISLLACFPSLTRLVAIDIHLEDEDDVIMKQQCMAVKDLYITGSFSIRTLARLMDCMPALNVLQIGFMNMVGECDFTLSPICRELTVLRMIAHDSAVSSDTLTRLLGFMPSVETVQLHCKEVTSGVNDSNVPLYESLTDFELSSNSDHCSCKVEAFVVINLFRHMPSLRSVQCRNVEITGDVNADMQGSLCPALSLFQLSGSVTLKTLVMLLECLPSTAKVKLDEMKLTDDALGKDIGERIIPISILSLCGALKKYEQNVFMFKINASSMIKFLGCMPLVTSVRLDKVELIEDIVAIAAPKCASLKHFQIGGSLSGNTLVRLLSCMPAVERVDLLKVDLTDEVDSMTPPLCTELLGFSLVGTSSIRTLKKLLSCMPSVKTFCFARVDICFLDPRAYMFPRHCPNMLRLGGQVDLKEIPKILGNIPLNSELQFEDVTGIGEIVTKISPTANLLKLQIRNSTVSAALLTYIMDCMQADKVSFDILGRESTNQDQTLAHSTSGSLMISGTLSASAMVAILDGIPSVTHLILNPVKLIGEVDSSVLPVCGDIEHICISGLWRENVLIRIIHCMPYSTDVQIYFSHDRLPNGCNSLMANSMLTMLAGLPSVRRVQFDSLDLQGDIDSRAGHSKFEMLKQFQISGQARSDTVVKLLQYMPSLETLILKSVVLEEATGLILQCKSLNTFVLEGQMSVSVLMQLICCMPSVTLVKIDLNISLSVHINKLLQLLSYLFVIRHLILKVGRVTGDLDSRLLPSCKSLEKLEMTRCRWITNANTFLRFIGCMPSVTVIKLSEIFQIVDDASDELSLPLLQELAAFTISGSLSINSLFQLVSCMPSLKQIVLDLVTLTGEAQNRESIVCSKVKEIVMGKLCNDRPSSRQCLLININTMIVLLGCMPSLTKVTLNAELKGELQQNIPPLMSIKDLKTTGRPLNVSTLMDMLHCMPLLSTLHLAPSELFGEVDGSKLPSCKALKKFDILSCDISSNTFIRILECMPVVETIKMAGVKMSGMINVPLPMCNSVTEYYLNGTLNADTLLKLLSVAPSVEKVTLNRVDVNGNADASVILKLDCLKDITITECDIDVQTLKSMLCQQKDLKSLTYVKSLTHTSHNNFQSFFDQVYHKQQLPEETMYLALPLDCCLEVLNVKLSSNVNATYIKGFEGVLPSLQEFHFSGGHNIGYLLASLKEVGQKCLASSSGTEYEGLPLVCIDIASCDVGDNIGFLNQASRYLPSLRHLLVRNCKLNEEHFQTMSESFSAHQLEELDLSENTGVMAMLGEGCEYLSILRVLKLVNTGLTDESVIQLPMSTLVKLRVLDLSNNQLSSEAALAVAEWLRRNCCPLLEHLSLQQNEMASYGACALAQVFKYIPYLKTFLLDQNLGVGGSACGIFEIFQNLKHLPHLEVLGLEGIALDVGSCIHIPLLSESLHYAGNWNRNMCRLQVVRAGNI